MNNKSLNDIRLIPVRGWHAASADGCFSIAYWLTAHGSGLRELGHNRIAVHVVLQPPHAPPVHADLLENPDTGRFHPVLRQPLPSAGSAELTHGAAVLVQGFDPVDHGHVEVTLAPIRSRQPGLDDGAGERACLVSDTVVMAHDYSLVCGFMQLQHAAGRPGEQLFFAAQPQDPAAARAAAAGTPPWPVADWRVYTAWVHRQPHDGAAWLEPCSIGAVDACVVPYTMRLDDLLRPALDRLGLRGGPTLGSRFRQVDAGPRKLDE